MAARKQPSKLELVILGLLWERGPLTTREVLESLPDGKERAYTSVLSVLQAMERKGHVAHTARANTNVYYAVAKRERTVGRVLSDMVRDVFGGSRAAAVQELLGGEEVTAEELNEIHRLIGNLKKQRGGDVK
nr:transcriptional repressor, BlaI/MecI family [uncultured bacterium]